MRKRIAVFLDGTWNASTDNTNVWRLKSLCGLKSNDGAAQISYYDRGVNGFWGGTFGKGLTQNVVNAYEWLVDNYTDGDEIFIFGFSRGAFTARSLAGLIAKYGVIRPGSPLGVGQLYERYKRADDKTIWKLKSDYSTDSESLTIEERWMLKDAIPARIKMVGVWDTVGALGIPYFHIKGVSRSTLGFLHTGLRLPIDHAFHAVAIDEHRASFKPTLWTVKETTLATPRSISSVEQRWFVGAHANVGGGYYSDLLAQRPLQWMMKKAQSLGLSFRYDMEIDQNTIEAAVVDSYRTFLRSCYRFCVRKFDRQIGLSERVVDGVKSSTINETIDSSVFDRWRGDPSYRPASIAQWASRRNVDARTIFGSIRADDPTTTVDD